MLCGGSAFGLAAADGAVGWLEEHGRGFPTPAGRVPIVVAAALFDLGVGDPSVRPGPAEGRAACEDARESSVCWRVVADQKNAHRLRPSRPWALLLIAARRAESRTFVSRGRISMVTRRARSGITDRS